MKISDEELKFQFHTGSIKSHDQGGITRETDLMKSFYPFWRPLPMDLPEEDEC